MASHISNRSKHKSIEKETGHDKIGKHDVLSKLLGSPRDDGQSIYEFDMDKETRQIRVWNMASGV